MKSKLYNVRGVAIILSQYPWTALAKATNKQSYAFARLSALAEQRGYKSFEDVNVSKIIGWLNNVDDDDFNTLGELAAFVAFYENLPYLSNGNYELSEVTV